MVILDNLAIHHHRMHVSTPGLIHNVSIGVEQWEHHRRLVIFNQDKISFLAYCDATDDTVHPQRLSAPERRPHHNMLSAQVIESDAFIALVRFQVLTASVRVECRPHRGEQVSAPPHAGVHRKRNWDVMPPEVPGGWVALTSIHLALSGHRCVAACCCYAMIRVFGQGCRMHIDGGGGHESVLVHQTDAIIVGSAPYASMSRHR